MSKFKNLKGPATEKQKERLKIWEIEFSDNLTKQEASDLISNYNKPNICDICYKQIKYVAPEVEALIGYNTCKCDGSDVEEHYDTYW
jgi:hypothetical protein